MDLRSLAPFLLMKKLFFSLFFFIFIDICGLNAAVLPILVYHHIAPKVIRGVSCTPARFEEQIQAILKTGFTPISLNDTMRFLRGELKDIENPVLITFDDGYESVYEYALPIAKKYKIKMVLFMVTARLAMKPQFLSYLKDFQIKEMYESGFFEFGSHTHDLHTNSIQIFTAFRNFSRTNPVLKLLEEDLKQSSLILEGILGVKPMSLAWPYGKYNSLYSNIAKEQGFELQFTSDNGFNTVGDSPYTLKRIPVSSADNATRILKKLGRPVNNTSTELKPTQQ